MADDTKHDCQDGDVVHLGPEFPNGMRPFVRHLEDHTVVTGFGVAKPLESGAPIPDGSLLLSPRDEAGSFNVTEIKAARHDQAAAAAHKGPAQVCTPAYARNYDTIFGTKAPRGQA